MQAFYFSLVVNTLYFLADVFIKLGSIQYSAARLIFIRSLFSVVFAALMIPIFDGVFLVPDAFTFTQILACSLLNAYGLFAYIKALQKIHFVNVAIIGIAGALIHYLIAGIIENKLPGTWFYLASIICVLGILIQWKDLTNKQGLWWAISSAIAWGFGYALLSFPLQHTSASMSTFISEFTLLITSFVLIKREDHVEQNSFKSIFYMALIAIFTIAGSVLLNISYTKFNLNLMGFMQLAFFPYSLLAGFFIFKEKLSTREWIGISLIGIGLVIYFFKVSA